MKNPPSLRSFPGPYIRLGLVVLVGLLIGAATVQAEPAADVAPSYSDQWGPAVGSPLPLLDAADQSGTRRALGDLVGRKGLLLVLVRSADW